jgi:hypothetical protein
VEEVGKSVEESARRKDYVDLMALLRQIEMLERQGWEILVHVGQGSCWVWGYDLLGEKYDIGKFILAIGAQQQSVDVINLPSITTAVSDKRIQSSL